MAEDRGKWLSTATALFFAWASLSLGVRIWVKARKSRWGYDDSAVGAAFVVTLLHVAAILWAVSEGYGKSLIDIEPAVRGQVEGSLYAGQISYILAIGLTRISAALFIGALTRHRPQVRNAYILSGICAVWTVASTFVIALRDDLSRPWTTLDGSNSLWIRWIVIEAVGLLLEVAIFGMSISLIWGLQMKIEKRVVILGAFGSRLGLIPLIVIRLLYLEPARNADPTFTSALPGIITEAALEFSLFSTSITALKPFLRPFHTGAIVNTVGGTGSGLAYGSKGSNGIYMLSGNRDDGKEEFQLNITTVTANRSQNEVADVATSSPKHSKQPPGRHNDVPDDVESVKSEGGSADMIIRTTKDWTVRYEYR